MLALGELVREPAGDPPDGRPGLGMAGSGQPAGTCRDLGVGPDQATNVRSGVAERTSELLGLGELERLDA